MAATRARRVGMTGLLDTNVALYLLGGRLAAPLPAGDYGISVISEMELLSWPSLTPEEERKLRRFLQEITVCELAPLFARVPSAKDQRLKLTRRRRLRDRAMEFAVPLWTNDQNLVNVPGLTCRAVAPHTALVRDNNWGAHATRVLVSTTRRNELFY